MINNNKKIYLIVPSVLKDVQPVPRFLTKFHVPPFITLCANLCCNLDKPPLVSEYCGDSISNCTAIPVPAGEAEQLCQHPILEVGCIERVDVQKKFYFECWTPGRYCAHKVAVNSWCSI